MMMNINNNKTTWMMNILSLHYRRIIIIILLLLAVVKQTHQPAHVLYLYAYANNGKYRCYHLLCCIFFINIILLSSYCYY